MGINGCYREREKERERERSFIDNQDSDQPKLTRRREQVFTRNKFSR